MGSSAASGDATTGQPLDVHVHRRRPGPGRDQGDRRHEGDRVSDLSHPIRGQHRPVGHHDSNHVIGNVSRREHRDDARHFHGIAHVHAPDPTVGHRRPHDSTVEHVGKAEVREVSSGASDYILGTPERDRPTDHIGLARGLISTGATVRADTRATGDTRSGRTELQGLS